MEFWNSVQNWIQSSNERDKWANLPFVDPFFHKVLNLHKLPLSTFFLREIHN